MKRRKTISILVCVCLLLTMIPAAAFAEELEPTANTQPSATVAVPSQETAAQPQETPAVPVKEPAAQPEESQVSEPAPESPSAPVDPAAATEDAITDENQSSDQLAASEPTTDQNVAPTSTASSMKKAIASTAVLNTNAIAKTKATSTKTVATVKSTISGIKVIGGVEGKDWVYDPKEQTLSIMKNGITVSGTATDNLAILCALAATTLTIKDLNEGKNTIIISSLDESGAISNLNIVVKGNNKIMAVVSSRDLTLTGTKNSSLNLSLGAIASNDLSVKNAKVNGGLFMAARDINISGSSKVTAKPTSYSKLLTSLGLVPAMIFAGRDINVNLSSGGSVTAKGMNLGKDSLLFDKVLPLAAMRNINISAGSKIVTPNGGKIGRASLLGIVPVQAVLNADGTPALDTVIKSTADLTASASMNDGSPQTGDNSMSKIMWAFTLAALAASALAALIMFRRMGMQK